MRKQFATLLAIASLLAAPATPGLRAQAASADADLPTVAVMDFSGFMLGQSGNSAPIGKAVSSMLVTELSERDGMRVIERTELKSLLQEQRLALSGRVDESTAIEVGRMLGVQYMVFGVATGVMETLRLDMRVVNVETSEVLEVQKLSDDVNRLLSLVVRMADLFAAKLDLDPPSARPDVEEIPAMATIHFSRGLDFEDQGDTESAMEMYRKTLEVYPEHREAGRALERLESEGGTP